MDTEINAVGETHRFYLLFSGVDTLTEELGNALFEAGCDDATVGLRDGVLSFNFRRHSATFREALISAIEDVERSGHPLRLVRVEPFGSRGEPITSGARSLSDAN